MSELWSSFLSNTGRELWKWPNYFPIYEKHFSKFVNQSVTILEIGVAQGGSLQMWKRYLGPFALIVGIDIKPECASFEEDQIKIRIGSQSNIEFLSSVVKEFGVPDIVLDDGPHYSPFMRASFDFLYPLLPKNGVYLLEDCHCCYIPECCGIGPKGKSFIEQAKEMIDSVNAPHSKAPMDDFAKTTNSISFYENVVVFEKGVKMSSPSIRTGVGIPGWVY